MEDVARYCGLSTATVSRALRGFSNVSPETRELVEAAAATLNYVVSPAASSLASGRYQAVAVVKSSSTNWYTSGVLDGVVETLSAEGFDSLLVNSDGAPTGRWWPLSSSLRRRAGALILLHADFESSIIDEILAAELPTVAVGASISGVRSIAIDDNAATRLAIDHLLALGHRRVGLISLGSPTRQGLESRARADEYRAVLQSRELEIGSHSAVFGGESVSTAKRAALAMLQRRDRPSAVFATSDEMAFGVILAAKDLGISIPEQLSVIGIDDHPMSESFGLTTVRQYPRRQGASAALHVAHQLRVGGTQRRSRPAMIKLITRDSTMQFSQGSN